MKRERLVRYGVLTVTPDVAEALRKVEQEARGKGFKVALQKPEPDADAPRQTSMVEAGRCVYMEAVFEEEVPRPVALAQLWSVVVPLRFTPWLRDPIPGHKDQVFHYLGPWKMLYDRLIAQGRGEHAWVSSCIAAQCDVGVWDGDRELQRFVQAQLHRVGGNPGPVDGRIGARTIAAIHALGLKDMRDLTLLAEELKKRPTGVISRRDRVYGHVVIPGKEIHVESHGMVKATKTPNGVNLAVDGPGRVVVDIKG